MASTNFTHITRKLATGAVNFSTLSLKVILVSSVPSESDLDTWEFLSDVTNEITGTGYTAGGIAQAFTLNALDTTGNKQTVTLTNNASAWTSASFSTVGSIIYIDTGSSATSSLFGFIDFGGTKTVSSSTFGLTYTQDFAITR